MLHILADDDNRIEKNERQRQDDQCPQSGQYHPSRSSQSKLSTEVEPEDQSDRQNGQ